MGARAVRFPRNEEGARGAPAGKPREKLLTPASMLQIVGETYG